MLAGRGATSWDLLHHQLRVRVPLSVVLDLLTCASLSLCLKQYAVGCGLIGCARQQHRTRQETRSPGQRHRPRVVQAFPTMSPSSF